VRVNLFSSSSALKRVEIASILHQLGLPDEYRASAAYARRTGVNLEAVDCSEFSRERIETLSEMIPAEKIERLLHLESPRQSVSSGYAQAVRRISEGPSVCETPPADSQRWRVRERQMACRMISALERFSPEQPVYIGRW